jgi:glycosyltransferase involved in cell wall biosynthesis
MQKKTILYIGNKLSNNGATVTSIETLGVFLEAEGFDVYTASSAENKFLRLLDMLFSVFRYSKKVSIVLIDTYSTQNFYFAVIVAKLCRLLKLPYVPILRGGNLPQRLVNNNQLSTALFKGAKINIAPSLYLMDAFADAGYRNLQYIPNTIKIESYPFLLRNNLKPNLLWVRSFAEIYNPMLAVEIVKELYDVGVNATLTMVGPDKDGSLEKCRSLVNEHKLPVSFTGKLEKNQWIDLSKSHDIFINTTNFDNTPVSVIEAMSLGLPIISTNVGGIPYLIKNDTTGILVPPNDATEFVAAIYRLINDSELASQLSMNARDKVEKYDWQEVKSLWLELLSE